ncbi:pro-opiomelanocortin-like [Echeneis naucrates]|uniref:pro-opiomelanocortin-like n=1 Tax=Echeneis naucrates TaxID=173247 RepID=UPI0011145E12|nr:pro-opiomelanocortin-like [Echeneis naucrates]
MVCRCWFLALVMAYVCVSGSESSCWKSSICSDMNHQGTIMDCIQLCLSLIPTEMPEVSTLGLKMSDGNVDDYDDEHLLSIILGTLASSDSKIAESDLQAHRDQRRSYLMEHFRWGKPPGHKILEPKLRDHSDERRAYSMEHFRWGKPSGRKRRPIKVFASSLEGGGSSEGGFPPQARRQLSSNEGETIGDMNQESHQYQELLGAKVSSKSQVLLSPQDRKDGTYRMNHFRWNNPHVSKRDGGLMKLLEEKP